jgi:hypothetical protein
MGVGGGSSGPSALIVGEGTDDGEARFDLVAGSSSLDKLASSSQESATGFVEGFLEGLDGTGAEVLLGIGRDISWTGPLLPMARSRSVDWSSALGSDMAREGAAFRWGSLSFEGETRRGCIAGGVYV